MTLTSALPEKTYNLHSLLEHIEPHVGWGPIIGQNMLVEILSPTDAEEEPPGHHRGARRRRVSDNRRVRPYQRTRHARPQAEAISHLGDCADDAPNEGALPLAICPGMKVVGDEGKCETHLLCSLRVAHEVGRRSALRWKVRSRNPSCMLFVWRRDALWFPQFSQEYLITPYTGNGHPSLQQIPFRAPRA